MLVYHCETRGVIGNSQQASYVRLSTIERRDLSELFVLEYDLWKILRPLELYDHWETTTQCSILDCNCFYIPPTHKYGLGVTNNIMLWMWVGMDDILHLWKLKIFAEQCIFLCECINLWVNNMNNSGLLSRLLCLCYTRPSIRNISFKSRKNPEQSDLAHERTATLSSHTIWEDFANKN